MTSLIRPTLVSFFLLSLITGLVYPAFVTGGARAWDAMPSAIRHPPSDLIGQSFTAPKYFWSRPSATGPVPYNAAASSGSNLGPTNPVLDSLKQSRIAALRSADPGNNSPVPIDLITASGSGLDPHISPDAAEYQVRRVARVRGLSVDSVRSLVRVATSGRQFAILGEPVVNVLQLNRALDRLTPAP